MEKRKSLKQVLMERDNISEIEAIKQIDECREELYQRMSEGGLPFDICEEHFGLEPDYLEDLL